MICTVTGEDLTAIRALIKSILDYWHHKWRSDALERALCAADGIDSRYRAGIGQMRLCNSISEVR